MKILAILFVVFALGCKMKKDFVRDIPDLKNDTSLTLIGLQLSADSFHLPRLENGFDSLQIRISLSYIKNDTFQVITIRNHAHKWETQLNEAILTSDPRTDSLCYNERKQWQLHPDENWTLLIDSIFQLGLMTLPDRTKVMSVNELPLDGANNATFEIATKDLYRIYSYEAPSSFQTEYKEAASVAAILAMLSRHLSIRYLGKL
jgi:hypothetical protein